MFKIEKKKKEDIETRLRLQIKHKAPFSIIFKPLLLFTHVQQHGKFSYTKYLCLYIDGHAGSLVHNRYPDGESQVGCNTMQ